MRNAGRTTAMAEKYFGGRLPEARQTNPELDEGLIAQVSALRGQYEGQMEKYHFRFLLDAVQLFQFLGHVNAGEQVLALAHRYACGQYAPFTLDDGTGADRQILSGIAKWYNPEDLIGKTLIAIVNLPPRKTCAPLRLRAVRPTRPRCPRSGRMRPRRSAGISFHSSQA